MNHINKNYNLNALALIMAYYVINDDSGEKIDNISIKRLKNIKKFF